MDQLKETRLCLAGRICSYKARVFNKMSLRSDNGYSTAMGRSGKVVKTEERRSDRKRRVAERERGGREQICSLPSFVLVLLVHEIEKGGEKGEWGIPWQGGDWKQPPIRAECLLTRFLPCSWNANSCAF